MSRCAGIPVLLVDADAVFRQALAENLRNDGHQVVECPSADDARPAMRAGPCIALVTEYVVSGADGVRLAEEFLALCAGPTVIVTAHSIGAAGTEGRLRPRLGLLPKPVDYERLHELLHRLVEFAGIEAGGRLES